MYPVKKSTNMTTVTRSREVRFCIRFLQMLHHIFDNATQVLLCKYNRQMLENMKTKPNNNLVPYGDIMCSQHPPLGRMKTLISM